MNLYSSQNCEGKANSGDKHVSIYHNKKLKTTFLFSLHKIFNKPTQIKPTGISSCPLRPHLSRPCHIFEYLRHAEITAYHCPFVKRNLVKHTHTSRKQNFHNTVTTYWITYTHFWFRYWENMSPSNCWNTKTSCFVGLREAQLCSEIHSGDSSCSTQLWKKCHMDILYMIWSFHGKSID
jgi:hypothetical protein